VQSTMRMQRKEIIPQRVTRSPRLSSLPIATPMSNEERFAYHAPTCVQDWHSHIPISSLKVSGSLLILRVTKIPDAVPMIWQSLLAVSESQMPWVHCARPFKLVRKKPKTHSPKRATLPLLNLPEDRSYPVMAFRTTK